MGNKRHALQGVSRIDLAVGSLRRNARALYSAHAPAYCPRYKQLPNKQAREIIPGEDGKPAHTYMIKDNRTGKFVPRPGSFSSTPTATRFLR